MFKDIYCNVVLDNTIVLGNLQKCAWLVTPIKPLWNGLMKAFHDGLCPNKTTIHFEPMTDMPVIILVSTQPCRHDLVLTFNQPLDWKVMEIITEKSQNVLSIKWIQYSIYTDIQFLLELIYAEHTFPYILFGKVFACAT